MVDNYPVMAFVDPTLFCNLGCPACPTGVKAGLRPRATLDWELYQSFIDEVGDYLFKLYLYNLGEPLLHKQAPRMVEYAKKKEIFVMVSSNLSIKFEEQYLRDLITSGLDVLVVALDGVTAESYSKYRRGGDFELVKANMQRIQQLKRELNVDSPKLIWQFLVFQHNEHEVDTVKGQYREWGADEYCIGGAYMPSLDHTGELAPSTLPEFNIYQNDHLHRRKTMQAFLERKPCSWLYGATVLNANGRISPCSYTTSEKDDFGAFTGANFLQAYNGSRFVQARALNGPGQANWQGRDDWETILKRMNGRGADVSRGLSQDQLLCHQCPVPFLRDVIEHELTFDEAELVKYVEKNYDLTDEEKALLETLKSA